MREITCPSGLKLKVRGLKGKELSIFQDKAAQRSGDFIDQILNACVTEVVDPGPYKVTGPRPRWDETLLGDKFFTVVAVRIETYGADYDFNTQCPECRQSIPWSVKLDALPVKTLAPDDTEAFRSGEPLVAHVPSDGREVKFRLVIGKDERTAAKAKATENPLIKMTALRIVELDGYTDRNKIEAFLDDCSLGDLTKLLKEFDARDCGVETSIDIECPNCLATKEIALPLGKAFLFPI